MGTSAARILLIEDDPAFAYLLKRALDAEPFPCKLTALDDGAEALTFIEGRGESTHLSAPALAAPDLIVLDPHLPKYNGIELL